MVTGDIPCESLLTPSVTVAHEHENMLLQNATSLSAYSTYQNSSLYISLFLVFSFAVLSVPTYQALMLRLILRRSRFSLFSFFEFNLRPMLCALLVIIIWLLLAWTMYRFDAKVQLQRRDVEWELVPSLFMEKLGVSTVILFLSVPLVALASQHLRVKAHRNKLRVVAVKLDNVNSQNLVDCTHYVERTSPADGNCLFHSMSHFLMHVGPNQIPFGPHSDPSHVALRCQIIEYLKAHCDSICVGNTGLPLRSYVETEMPGVCFDRCAIVPRSLHLFSTGVRC